VQQSLQELSEHSRGQEEWKKVRNEELEEISEQVRHLVATVDAKNAELQQVKLEKEKIRQKQKRK